MNTDLNSTFPAPRRLALAGRSFLVAPLTFGSFARLQAWLKGRHPHPGAELQGRRHQIVEALGRPAYGRALAAAYEHAESWPPSPLGQAGCSTLLGSDAGLAELLRVALLQEGQDLDDAEVLDVLRGLTLDEVDDLVRIAFDRSPAVDLEAEILAIVDPGSLERDDGDADWADMIARACRKPYSLSFEDVRAMTPTQLVMLLSGGRWSPKLSLESGARGDADFMAAARRRRAAWKRLTEPEPEDGAVEATGPIEADRTPGEVTRG